MGDDMLEKQRGLLEHYRDTYDATFRFEQERNRLFQVLIVVLIASTYLAFDKDTANSFLAALAPGSANAQAEMKKLNLYNVFSVFSLLACLYLIVNLHHRFATIKRNYKYLAALEKEIRNELGIQPPAVAFSRESEFYTANKLGFFLFAKLNYSIILVSFVLLFLGVRIWGDWPETWRAGIDFGTGIGKQAALNDFIFVLDIGLGTSLLIALIAYIVLSMR
jgi:hypothetical protein